MGRPISKKWFSVKEGSDAGDLQVTTMAGPEVIINQKGTGVYTVASGRVKLVDGAPAVAGEAQLQHDGNNVRKLSQYRVYYFDAAIPDGVWRDGDAAIVGTFTPPLASETPVPPVPSTATATATAANGLVGAYTVTDGGATYAAAPAVTVSAPDATQATAGVIAVDEGTAANDPGTITSIAVGSGGSGYASAPAVTITGTNTGAAAATAVLTNGVVTSITVDTAGTGYGIADVAVTIAAESTVQETATATITGDAVTSIASDGNGIGYAAAPTVTVAAP